MKYFTWIINANEESFFVSKELLSNSYFFPSSDEDLASNLVGGEIFLILRGGQGDILIRKLNVQSVEEKIEDDNSILGFVLNINLLQSFAITTSYSTGVESAIIHSSFKLPLGIRMANDEMLHEINSTIKRNSFIRFKEPSSRELTLEKPSNLFPNSACASMLIKSIIKHHSLDRIWGTISFQNPFLCFAHAYLSFWRTDNISTWENILKRYLVSATSDTPASIQKPPDAAPNVDVNFELIKPDQIFARKYIAATDAFLEDNRLEKTENAEKRHQLMLKDISERILALGLSPLQSTSIDLAIKRNNLYSFFELKTTNCQNAISQAGKGVFQLGMYSTAAKQAGLILSDVFLIVEPINNEFDSFLYESVKSLGIKLIFYSAQKPWPERLYVISGKPFNFVELH